MSQSWAVQNGFVLRRDIRRLTLTASIGGRETIRTMRISRRRWRETELMCRLADAMTQGSPPLQGATLELQTTGGAASTYVVARVGAAPFPGVRIPCAYLVAV